MNGVKASRRCERESTVTSTSGGSQGRAVAVGMAPPVAVSGNSTHEISDLRGEFGAEYYIEGCGIFT